MTGPDVTVVVISFNDAERLTRAIRSVQRQTLRNLEIVVVDDASTDGTAPAVAALAAQDARIRYERLERNSGGCSAPRNRGMDLARAPWLMFCDSDDEYDRHACKNLLETAERLDADVVCGTAERVDVATGRTRRWRPELHDSLRVEDGIEGFPELLHDTIAVNKIFRRAMLEGAGLRFPEGLLFEDQLFTLEALASSRRIAAIPETVYRWHVDRLSDEPSITQRRHEVRNVESRIEINRRMDAFLQARGLAGLQRIKDAKFLRHDLYLYLSTMLEADDETATALMERLVPYVSAMDLGPAWDLRPGLRVAVYHLLVGDLAGVRAAMAMVRWSSAVGERIVGEGDREFWGCGHLASGPEVGGRPARDWLDLTDVRALLVPFGQRRFLHELSSMDYRDGVLAASGTTVDYDGTLDSVDCLELRFVAGPRRVVLVLPAQWVSVSGAVRAWRATGRPAAIDGVPLTANERGTVVLAMARGGVVSAVPLRARTGHAPRLEVDHPRPRAKHGPDLIAVGPHDFGAVGWRAAASPAAGRAAGRRARRRRVPVIRNALALAAAIRSGILPGLVQRLGLLLPARNLVVVEGADREDDVRAIAEALHSSRPGLDQAWAYRGAGPVDVPAYARAVARYGLRHQWLMVRARIWLDDGTSPLTVRRRRGTHAVMAACDVPVHRIGLDDPGVLVSPAVVREVRRRGARTTSVLVASEWAGAIIRPALAVRGPASVVGQPRADRAARVRAAGAPGIDAWRAGLGLPADRRIVLLDPVARATAVPGPGFDLDAWARALGWRSYLLVRGPHGLDVPTRLASAVRDVRGVAAQADWVAAADLVISDYSSVIGLAALVDVPVLCFQPDRDTFVRRTTGLYQQDGAAGPVVTSMESLIDEVRSWLDDPDAWDAVHGPGRRAFAQHRCGPAGGGAAARAAAAVLDGRFA
ncbi:MAG: bifunctional glycosyltransferase/CDP-glycerol:glycerophosphate glycerophosphotransferase [Candidatus Nanopelagicales bacterium]